MLEIWDDAGDSFPKGRFWNFQEWGGGLPNMEDCFVLGIWGVLTLLRTMAHLTLGHSKDISK